MRIQSALAPSLALLLLSATFAPAQTDPGCPLCGPGDLVQPDPADLRDMYNNGLPLRPIAWDEFRCGDERVDRCENELGGSIEIVEGAGCFSSQQLLGLGLKGDLAKVQRLVKKGDIGKRNPDGTITTLAQGTPDQELLQLARDGLLVRWSAILRDERRLQLQRSTAAIELGVRGCECRCVVWDMVGPQVTNAEKGAVGLVPAADGGGEDIVRLLMNTLGQNHRHAVIFTSASTIRHNTSYDEIDEDDLESNTRIKPGILRNGTPGILTETVEEALDSERLGYAGLLLKVHDDFLSRGLAENAADIADAATGYYKISDYSGLDGMVRPWASESSPDYDTDDLRGTQCSGFVHHAFTSAGFVLTDSFYSKAVRENAADVLYTQIKSDIKAGLGFWGDLGSFLTGAAKHLSNQVTNCFAGLGCNDNSNAWKSDITSARTVSPDNLLPPAFDVTGSGAAPWDRGIIVPGDHVTHTNGATTTPFSIVEPMNVVGTTWTETTHILW